MNKRTTATNIEKRLLDAKETCEYLSLGRNNGLKFAKEIGAERKVGKRCLYDKKVIDHYLDRHIKAV